MATPLIFAGTNGQVMVPTVLELNSSLVELHRLAASTDPLPLPFSVEGIAQWLQLFATRQIEGRLLKELLPTSSRFKCWSRLLALTDYLGTDDFYWWLLAEIVARRPPPALRSSLSDDLRLDLDIASRQQFRIEFEVKITQQPIFSSPDGRRHITRTLELIQYQEGRWSRTDLTTTYPRITTLLTPKRVSLCAPRLQLKNRSEYCFCDYRGVPQVVLEEDSRWRQYDLSNDSVIELGSDDPQFFRDDIGAAPVANAPIISLRKDAGILSAHIRVSGGDQEVIFRYEADEDDISYTYDKLPLYKNCSLDGRYIIVEPGMLWDTVAAIVVSTPVRHSLCYLLEDRLLWISATDIMVAPLAKLTVDVDWNIVGRSVLPLTGELQQLSTKWGYGRRIKLAVLPTQDILVTILSRDGRRWLEEHLFLISRANTLADLYYSCSPYII